MTNREAEVMADAEMDSEVEREEKWEAKDYIEESEKEGWDPSKPMAWDIAYETGSEVESFITKVLEDRREVETDQPKRTRHFIIDDKDFDEI